MIYHDNTRIGYDFDMEVACCIPLRPGFVVLADLAADLGFANQSELREAIKRLTPHYAGIEVRANLDCQKGRVAWCTRLGWKKLQDAGDEYWARIYDPPAIPQPRMGGHEPCTVPGHHLEFRQPAACSGLDSHS